MYLRSEECYWEIVEFGITTISASDNMSDTKNVGSGETTVWKEPHGPRDLENSQKCDESERARSKDKVEDIDQSEKKDEMIRHEDADAIAEPKNSTASSDTVNSRNDEQLPMRTEILAQNGEATDESSRGANSKDQIRLVGIRLVIVETWHFLQSLFLTALANTNCQPMSWIAIKYRGYLNNLYSSCHDRRLFQ